MMASSVRAPSFTRQRSSGSPVDLRCLSAVSSTSAVTSEASRRVWASAFSSGNRPSAGQTRRVADREERRDAFERSRSDARDAVQVGDPAKRSLRFAVAHDSLRDDGADPRNRFELLGAGAIGIDRLGSLRLRRGRIGARPPPRLPFVNGAGNPPDLRLEQRGTAREGRPFEHLPGPCRVRFERALRTEPREPRRPPGGRAYEPRTQCRDQRGDDDERALAGGQRRHAGLRAYCMALKPAYRRIAPSVESREPTRTWCKKRNSRGEKRSGS